MKTKKTNIATQGKTFAWIAVGTAFLLMMPFLFMKLKIPLYDPGSGYEVISWNLFDFIVMGLLIFGTGSLFIFVSRIIKKKSQKIILAIVLLLTFLWLWAELAVGVFTNWGD